MGRLLPIAVQQDYSIVLHIADQHGCADLHLGIGLGILHRKLQAVLFIFGGLQDCLGRHTYRAVRPFLALSLCSREDSVLPYGDIGIILIGKDTYSGAKAKSGGLRPIAAAFIGALYLVLHLLDAALGILGLPVLGGVYRGLLDELGGIAGLFLMLFFTF